MLTRKSIKKYSFLNFFRNKISKKTCETCKFIWKTCKPQVCMKKLVKLVKPQVCGSVHPLTEMALFPKKYYPEPL